MIVKLLQHDALRTLHIAHFLVHPKCTQQEDDQGDGPDLPLRFAQFLIAQRHRAISTPIGRSSPVGFVEIAPQFQAVGLDGASDAHQREAQRQHEDETMHEVDGRPDDNQLVPTEQNTELRGSSKGLRKWFKC